MCCEEHAGEGGQEEPPHLGQSRTTPKFWDTNKRSKGSRIMCSNVDEVRGRLQRHELVAEGAGGEVRRRHETLPVPCARIRSPWLADLKLVPHFRNLLQTM